MTYDVAVLPCATYDLKTVKSALLEAIEAVGGLGFVTAGMTVAIKTNLVAGIAPDGAATSHPAVLSALTELLTERGASVVIGDSPGGLFTQTYVDKVYKAAGVYECETHGATLNRDFTEKTALFENAQVAKSFTYTAWLDSADVIIDVCKLKSHAMMGMSAAAKNMFGAIPGTVKPEYHFRYPSYEAFSDMIVDLDEYFKPALSICDAVVGMEGNGPTAGTPRPIGCLLASRSPHKLDLVAANIIGLSPTNVPTLVAAGRRGLVPADLSGLSVFGDPSRYALADFQNIATRHSILFKGASDNVLSNLFGRIAKRALDSRPKLKKKLCVGCNLCGRICPAKAITIDENKKASIDREKCIRCFCCQEFCPKGAMRVHRTFVARVLQPNRKKK